jgi:hypothetical protein
MTFEGIERKEQRGANTSSEFARKGATREERKKEGEERKREKGAQHA